MIDPILAKRRSVHFWIAAVATGVGAGIAAGVLTALLEWLQHLLWGGGGLDLLEAASNDAPWRHLTILLSAGVLTGAAQWLITTMSSANGIEITTAIWFYAGRLPPLRTLASATLSVIVVAMGAALGREGAPKQAGAVMANEMSNQFVLSDDERRLLVACSAGAGMAAAYGVPLGGALFSLEVLRGALALRFVLPALVTTLTATAVSWAFLPDAPTYHLPAYAGSVPSSVWAVLAGPMIGVASVAYVRAVSWADRRKPKGLKRVWAPILALGFLGTVSIAFPQVLGNGRDVAALAFNGQLEAGLLVLLLILRPVATILGLGSGVPGGLFTPSLTIGAMMGGVLGLPCSWLFPDQPPGLFAMLGAAAMLAATTQGPISTVVLMMELTGYARSATVPLLIAVATATLIARTIEPRSIYDARLTDSQVEARQRARDHVPEVMAA
jgi:H+/Cl- antiporter ClcA